MDWAKYGQISVGLTYLISLIIGTIYSVTERSPLLAQSLSVFMGTGTVFLVGY